MITDKFKKLVFGKLISDLSKVELILHDDSLWFIDRENKYWYLEFNKSGKLCWRWQFFTNFFSLFSMERDEFEPLISEWLESILNCGVTSTIMVGSLYPMKLESILNCGVTTMWEIQSDKVDQLKSVLNCGVTTTLGLSNNKVVKLKSVLNCGITSTLFSTMPNTKLLESVLNCGVTQMDASPFSFKNDVERILNCKVTSTVSNHLPGTKIIKSMLHNT